jgi:hypothetical protein
MSYAKWVIPCRKCGAVGFEPCLTPKRNPREYPHIDRARDNKGAK